MAYYRCLIHGKNFPGVLADEQGVVGFHTAVCVQTDDESEIETLALKRLQQYKALQLPDGVTAAAARVTIKEYFPIDADEYTDDDQGVVFYASDHDE